MNGARTESISSGPELMSAQLQAASIIEPCLAIQPDIVEVHRPCAASGRRGIPGAKADSYRVHIRKVHAECRQVYDPLIPA